MGHESENRPRAIVETTQQGAEISFDLLQRRIMKKIAEGRSRIARERELARSVARQIEEDVEAYLLGTKKVNAS